MTFKMEAIQTACSRHQQSSVKKKVSDWDLQNILKEYVMCAEKHFYSALHFFFFLTRLIIGRPWVEKTIHGLETFWLSDKEQFPGHKFILLEH